MRSSRHGNPYRYDNLCRKDPSIYKQLQGCSVFKCVLHVHAFISDTRHIQQIRRERTVSQQHHCHSRLFFISAFSRSGVTVCTTRVNNKKFYVLPTHYI